MKGFTLVELMIVVVIIGIMAMVAVPTFENSMNKSRRSDAKASLVALQLEMEKFRGSCALFPTALAGADDCAGRTIEYDTSSSEGYYTLSVVAADSSGNAFTIKATAVATGAQKDDDDCDPMQIAVTAANPKGVKTPAGCW